MSQPRNTRQTPGSSTEATQLAGSTNSLALASRKLRRDCLLFPGPQFCLNRGLVNVAIPLIPALSPRRGSTCLAPVQMLFSLSPRERAGVRGKGPSANQTFVETMTSTLVHSTNHQLPITNHQSPASSSSPARTPRLRLPPQPFLVACSRAVFSFRRTPYCSRL